jgi:hypothetical protein
MSVRPKLLLAAFLFGWTGAGCQHVLPKFAHIAKSERLDGTSPRSISSAPNGERWLVVRELTDALLYTDLSSAPKLRELPRLVRGGFLDDERVFLASADTVDIWNASFDERLVHEQIPTAPDPHLPGDLLQVSPSGRFIAKDIAVYDTHERRWLALAARHGHQSVLEFSGDAWLLSGGFWDERIVLRSLTDDTLREWSTPDKITSATFDPASGWIFVGTKGGAFAYHKDGDAQGRKVASGEIVDVALFDEGRALAVLSVRHLKVIDTKSLRERASFRLEAEGRALSADGTLVAAGDSEGRVYAWDGREARLLASEMVLPGLVISIAVNARVRRALAASSDARAVNLVMLTLPGLVASPAVVSAPRD